METLSIPLLVGVVGHRDLVPEELPALRAAALDLLRALRDAQPDVPVRLLSAQAEGADLLVAEAAHALGIGVIAVLPFPAAQCRAELATDAARAAFDRTMAGAEVLELEPAAGAAAAAADVGAARDRQFERAGDLIAQHCTLLIAIWDGRDTPHRAGTARVIERRRSRAGVMDYDDNDLVYEIRCSRRRDAGERAGVRVTGFVAADAVHGAVGAGLPPTLATLLARTAQFNRDLRAQAAGIAAHGPTLAAAATYPVTGALDYLDRLFSAADWLAVRCRRAFARALAARFGLWALMAFLLLAFKKSADELGGLVSIVLVLLVFALGWALAFVARRRSWDRRYLDYRALAEGLRVDYYWELSGVRAQFDDAFAHENFLQKQDAQTEWMRAAMRAANLRCALCPPAAAADGFRLALEAWVGDPGHDAGGGQLQYYRQRAAALERRLAGAEHVARAMLIGGLALALLLGVDLGRSVFAGEALLAPPLRAAAMMALALLTAYTAIFEIYLAEKADRSLVRQYRHMATLLGAARRQLRDSQGSAERLAILRALGHACLTEHAQWILSHRDRRVDGLRW
jgi:hypothetical protein